MLFNLVQSWVLSFNILSPNDQRWVFALFSVFTLFNYSLIFLFHFIFESQFCLPPQPTPHPLLPKDKASFGKSAKAGTLT